MSSHNYQNSQEKGKLSNSDVGYINANFFFIYNHECDIEYKEAFYMNNYDIMKKAFMRKFGKNRELIKKLLKPEEMEFLDNNDEINKLMMQIKRGDNDYTDQCNFNISLKIIDIIEEKQRILEAKISEAGLNVFLTKIKEWKPAALAGDDF